MYMPYHVHCLSEIAVSSECWTITKQSHCILSTITYLASLFIISSGFAKRMHDNNGFYKITYWSAMAILTAGHNGLTECEVTRQYLVVMMGARYARPALDRSSRHISVMTAISTGRQNDQCKLGLSNTKTIKKQIEVSELTSQLSLSSFLFTSWTCLCSSLTSADST